MPANFATNIIMLQISELPKFCHEYINVSNLATILLRNIENVAKLKNATNFKQSLILKCCKVSQMFRFIPTFVLLFR